MSQVMAVFRALAIGVFAPVALAAFIFAGLSFDNDDYSAAIGATGMLAIALLTVQMWRQITFRPKTWNLRTAINTMIVGVAIHYSAIIIGVSFGAVFSPNGGSVDAITAVLVQQAVLTCAAWILVNEYSRSNTAGTDRKTPGG